MGERVVNCINTVEVYCKETNLLAIVKYCTDVLNYLFKNYINRVQRVQCKKYQIWPQRLKIYLEDGELRKSN